MQAEARSGDIINATHIKYLPPLHLLSGGHGADIGPWGMGSCWYNVFLTLCFLQSMFVPCSCHIFGNKILRIGKVENIKIYQ
jgi:hypothetical protein